LFQAFILLSVFLLIGTFLRAVLPIFQKTFLPASVIGGFLLLFAGPIVWEGGGLPIPSAWLITWGTLPGVLIVPVVASVPLGLKFSDAGNTDRSYSNIIKMFCIIFIVYVVQILIGIGTNMAFRRTHDLYSIFGIELALGYLGGHGTAAVLGGFLYGIDFGYWEISQGITTATATIGLVAAVVVGIVYINVMARMGKTSIITKPSEIPLDMAKGIQMDPNLQKSTGAETTLNSSIESLTFHISIILLACGIAYVLMAQVQLHQIPLITQIPVWTYAIVVMFGVNAAINMLGLNSLVCSKTKSRITGALTDYAIIAAIASMPIRAVLAYVVPLVFMSTIGLVASYLLVVVLCKYFFPDDYAVERAVTLWGLCIGVFITAVMLLKITDPDFKSPVLKDFSVAFSFWSPVFFITLPIMVNLLIYSTLESTALITLVMLVVAFIVARTAL